MPHRRSLGCSTALEPMAQLQSELVSVVASTRQAGAKASGVPAAGLLGGVSPPHIPGLLSAVRQRLPVNLPLPQVPDASP
jgi:hypothetical protein